MCHQIPSKHHIQVALESRYKGWIIWGPKIISGMEYCLQSVNETTSKSGNFVFADVIIDEFVISDSIFDQYHQPQGTKALDLYEMCFYPWVSLVETFS